MQVNCEGSAHDFIREIDELRQAGVSRGLNASVQALEELKAEYIGMGQSLAAGVINTAIVKLQALTVEEVEG